MYRHALFGDVTNLAKAQNSIKFNRLKLLLKARNIRSKNLLLRSLKFQEEQDHLAGKKLQRVKLVAKPF